MDCRKFLLGAGLVVAALGTCAVALADDAKKDTKAPGSGPNPYSDCGIGSALFSETKWAAVISNVIWDLGTTAVISATASPETCSGKKVAAAQFINHTYANLTEEVAVGTGEHLTTVLNIMECDARRHTQATAQIRGAMAKVVSAPAYTGQSHIEKAVTFYNVLENAVNTSCSV
jgi:hypothetical protein